MLDVPATDTSPVDIEERECHIRIEEGRLFTKTRMPEVPEQICSIGRANSVLMVFSNIGLRHFSDVAFSRLASGKRTFKKGRGLPPLKPRLTLEGTRSETRSIFCLTRLSIFDHSGAWSRSVPMSSRI
ncbi:hypothetical protein DC522_25385 [Microvirga sp. KLBC 81]|nr:hypothetical protein DC522_25385 [Microvirga sp. KLBC 81]